MVSDIFNEQSFREFLGNPLSEGDKPWGREVKYKIGQEQLRTFEIKLRTTAYHHHSSFDYFAELKELGFPKTAAILYDRRSGLPNSHDTQMGNFAEIIGSEYLQQIMGIDTTMVFPKRFNPNIDQSMKGIDILGTYREGQELALLWGEAKCYKKFKKKSVQDSHKHLRDILMAPELSRLLAFHKEILHLEGNKREEAKIDLLSNTNPQEIKRNTLILVINQNEPYNPFEILDELCEKEPLPNLLAIHICVSDLIEWMPRIFQTVPL